MKTRSETLVNQCLVVKNEYIRYARCKYCVYIICDIICIYIYMICIIMCLYYVNLMYINAYDAYDLNDVCDIS